MVKIVTDIEALRRMTTLCKDTDNLRVLAEQLFSAMREADGQGLAANQIAVDRRAFVIAMEKGPPIFMANPYVTVRKGKVEANEGCLSLPGVKVRVPRPKVIRVRGMNQYRKPVQYRLEGIEARRACHEIDHLIGKLIIDYQEGGKDGKT